jgi:predicted RNase H-like HicB family nuclease
MNPADYLNAPYHRVFVKEERGWSAWVAELPGAFGGGESLCEANLSLEAAIVLWVETELERGHDIPMPELEVNIPD